MAPKAKLPILLAVLCCALTFSFGSMRAATMPQQTQPPQSAPQVQQRQIETLASVNGQQITRHQVASECMRRFGEDVLENIIGKILVLNQCQQNGITITEKDINDELLQQAKKFGMSGERYVQVVCENRDLSEHRLKNEITWQQLAIRRLAADNIRVSADELAERMDFEFGPKVLVRQIVVNSAQQANQLHAQLQTDPESFERLAKQFSVDQHSKSMGGILPKIRRNSGLPEFENVAFALQPGEVSQIFPLADQFIILRCIQHYPADQLSPEDSTYHHDRLVEEVRKEKLGESARVLFEQMQENAQIVNVMNDPQLSQQNPGVAARVNNTNILVKDVAEECIARFGSTMLDTEIGRTLLMQALKSAGLQVEQADIQAEIARAAEANGLLHDDGSPNIDQWLAIRTNNDLSKVDLYIEDEVWPTVALKKLVEPTVSVTEEDMQKGYEANYGPKVEVLAIVANDHRNALRWWEMASRNLTADFFGKLANQYSTDPMSKNNFGAVPPIPKHGGSPELENEAFSLQAGELSKVIQVGENWIIMFCLGRTTPVVTDFDAVKDELYKSILEKKLLIAMGETFRQMREDAQIDNFLAGTSQPGRDAVRQARQSNNSAQPAQRR